MHEPVQTTSSLFTSGYSYTKPSTPNVFSDQSVTSAQPLVQYISSPVWRRVLSPRHKTRLITIHLSTPAPPGVWLGIVHSTGSSSKSSGSNSPLLCAQLETPFYPHSGPSFAEVSSPLVTVGAAHRISCVLSFFILHLADRFGLLI